MRLLVTGEPITAEEAARWGLINEVVPDGTVLDAALALADKITVNAPWPCRPVSGWLSAPMTVW